MSEEEHEEILDLGFGSVVSRESTRRLLNRDGTFNVRRRGLGFFRSLSGYHFLLDTTWPRFLGLTVAVYIALNTLFALGYIALGPGALASGAGSPVPGFGSAFFFSVHARSSYTAAEIAFGSRFADMFDHESDSHLLSVDVGRLHDVEPVDSRLDGPIPGARA